MADSGPYLVPTSRHRAEQSIERSRFICTLDRAESPEGAQQFIREMNTEFPDATHNCWAYVIGAPGNTSRVGMSDAGEPHGTAGRPMLTVLLHSGVGEIVAVVTRYYGGTKLGTGGLVKAYSGSVKLALESLPTHERVDAIEVDIVFGYASVAPVRQLLSEIGATLVSQEQGTQVSYRVRLARTQLDRLRQDVANITRGTAFVSEID
jgi:uncharacterized YigZ family protein